MASEDSRPCDDAISTFVFGALDSVFFFFFFFFSFSNLLLLDLGDSKKILWWRGAFVLVFFRLTFLHSTGAGLGWGGFHGIHLSLDYMLVSLGAGLGLGNEGMLNGQDLFVCRIAVLGGG